MKNSKGKIRLFATEQMPDKEQMAEKLSNNLKSSNKSYIEFLVKNMKIEEPGDIGEKGISFEQDANNQNTIGAIKLEGIDKDHVREALDRINTTVSILSLLYNVSGWEPLMGEPKSKFSSALRLGQSDFKSVDDIFRSISKMDDEKKGVYFRALEWYRSGICSETPFNKFLAFYRSIEHLSDVLYQKKWRSEKRDCIENYFKKLSMYLFSWDNVPGKDRVRLLRILRDDFDIGWAENAEIRKSDGGKTIRIFKNENSAEIMIDEKKEKVSLKISDGRTRDLKVKKENGKIKIYSSIMIGGIERKHIDKCYNECLKTSSKDKIKFALEEVFKGDTGKIREFSEKFFEGDESFLKIRNDITHGKISEYSGNNRIVEEKLHDLHFKVKEFLLNVGDC